MAEFQLPRPPGLLPTRHSDGGGGLALANILANVMALPQTMENERIKQSQMRATAKAMGVPQDVLDTVAPGEDVPEPVGGTGITGKILSGVGKVGGTLKAILGAPIQAPRFTPTEAKDFEEGAARESLVGTLDKNDPEYVKKAAQIRLGKESEVFPGAPKNIIELAQAEADRLQIPQGQRYKWVSDEVTRMAGQTAGATTGARLSVTERAKITQQNEAIQQWNKDHPNDQRPLIPMPPDDTGAPPGTGAGGGGGAADNLGGGGGGPGHFSKNVLGPNDPVPKGTISPYDPRYTAAENKYGVPLGLVRSVHEHESNFRPTVQNAEGADVFGLGQFTKDTAARYGVDRLDAGSSIEGTAHYLHDLYQQYGDWTTALQHYGTGKDYPTGAILQRAAQYRQAMGGQPTGAPGQPPTQVAANVAPGTVSDVGGPAAIGIPKGSLTDTEGNVYSPDDMTKPLGKVVPGKSGQMIPTKDTLDVGGRKTETVNPEAPLLQDKDRNEAIRLLSEEGHREGEPGFEHMIFDKISQMKSHLKGFTEIDTARAAVGLKPGEQPTPDQADAIMAIMKDKEGDTGPVAALNKIELQRIDNQRLLTPIRAHVDPNDPESAYAYDKNGKPVYATWVDPRDGRTKPFRPIDTLVQNAFFSKLDPIAKMNQYHMESDPVYGEAMTILSQAPTNLVRFASLKGDAKRVAQPEYERMKTLVPTINDTPVSAYNKIRQSQMILDAMEPQFRRQLALGGGGYYDRPTAGQGQVAPSRNPPAGPAAPAPPAQPAAKRPKLKAPPGMQLEPLGPQ